MRPLAVVAMVDQGRHTDRVRMELAGADEVLFRLTKYGVGHAIGDPNYKSAMPAYEKTLSDEQIIAVLSWIKAQWPAPIRAKHDQINAQAKP